MKIRDLMTSDVKCCAPHDTLNAAAQIMWENDIGCIPVVDEERRVIGMLTDRDLCMTAYHQRVPLSDAPVTSAMSKQVFSCVADGDLTDAQKVMREKQVRRLPVIDPAGHLAGIISIADLVRWAQQQARATTDAEITRLMASVCAPRRHTRGPKRQKSGP
jgi:CBS domain-containing protein